MARIPKRNIWKIVLTSRGKVIKYLYYAASEEVIYDKFKIEKPEMVNKTFRLPLDLVEQMQTIAQNKNVSLNNLVVQCCEYALKNLEQ